MKNLDKQILDKIKDLKPKAKWKFLVKNYLIWSSNYFIFNIFFICLRTPFIPHN